MTFGVHNSYDPVLQRLEPANKMPAALDRLECVYGGKLAGKTMIIIVSPKRTVQSGR